MKPTWEGFDTILELLWHLDIQAISYELLLQQKEYEDTHWTKQTTQETDECSSGNYNIIVIN